MHIFARCKLVAAVALKFSNKKYKSCLYGLNSDIIQGPMCKVVSIHVSKPHKGYSDLI
jgi:hypothetical protein